MRYRLYADIPWLYIDGIRVRAGPAETGRFVDLIGNSSCQQNLRQQRVWIENGRRALTGYRVGPAQKGSGEGLSWARSTGRQAERTRASKTAGILAMARILITVIDAKKLA